MTKMIHYACGAAALLLMSGLSYAESVATDSFAQQGHELALGQAQGKCQLAIASQGKAKQTHALDLTPPCYFCAAEKLNRCITLIQNSMLRQRLLFWVTRCRRMS